MLMIKFFVTDHIK